MTLFLSESQKVNIKKGLNLLEVIVVIPVLLGVFIYAFSNIPGILANLDTIDGFYKFIKYILSIVVGLELAKLLITHNIYSIIDLIIFIIARKLITPDLTTFDILVGVVAFSLLFILTTYAKQRKLLDKLDFLD